MPALSFRKIPTAEALNRAVFSIHTEPPFTEHSCTVRFCMQKNTPNGSNKLLCSALCGFEKSIYVKSISIKLYRWGGGIRFGRYFRTELHCRNARREGFCSIFVTVNTHLGLILYPTGEFVKQYYAVFTEFAEIPCAGKRPKQPSFSTSKPPHTAQQNRLVCMLTLRALRNRPIAAEPAAYGKTRLIAQAKAALKQLPYPVTAATRSPYGLRR